jgi:hypothetical protein
MSTLLLKANASELLFQVKVLSPSEPPKIVIPPPSAVVFDGEVVVPIPIFLSYTTRFTVSIVVVVPLTVKFPVTVKAPPTVALLLTVKLVGLNVVTFNVPAVIIPLGLLRFPPPVTFKDPVTFALPVTFKEPETLVLPLIEAIPVTARVLDSGIVTVLPVLDLILSTLNVDILNLLFSYLGFIHQQYSNNIHHQLI